MSCTAVELLCCLTGICHSGDVFLRVKLQTLGLGMSAPQSPGCAVPHAASPPVGCTGLWGLPLAFHQPARGVQRPHGGAGCCWESGVVPTV